MTIDEETYCLFDGYMFLSSEKFMVPLPRHYRSYVESIKPELPVLLITQIWRLFSRVADYRYHDEN
jgi:hypothetical protein